jgi:hypothetical protein
MCEGWRYLFELSRGFKSLDLKPREASTESPTRSETEWSHPNFITNNSLARLIFQSRELLRSTYDFR